MATKEQLIACRKAYAEKGCKRIEVIRPDGKVSAVTDRVAIDAALGALVSEADRQLANGTEQGGANEKKERLAKCRDAYLDGGCQLVELTHQDGRVSGISNPDAIRAVMDALKDELDRQIASA